MDYQQISTSVRDHVMTVTLFRPVRLNAYTYRMRQEISDALDHADEDDEVRVVVFTGSGRAFCAGADLEMGADSFDPGVHAERFEGAVDDAEAFRDDGGRLVLRLYRSKKPLIAAINGAAVGVGATMTLPMDIRIASSNARFGFVFARRGITPDGCSTWFLPRVVGIDRALEWCFTGRVFDATEAKESGLVREVVAPADLLARAHELARTIAENTPRSRSRSPADSFGTCRASPTRKRPTCTNPGRCTGPAAPRTSVRVWSPSWRNAAPNSACA